MKLDKRSRFGSTELSVTPLCLGTSAWGPPRQGESDDDAHERIASLADAFFAGTLATNFLDTSNEYGQSLSEIQVGAAIRRTDGIAPGLVVQTKLDRDTETGNFTAARMWRSLEESQQRLGLERFPILYLHDPENIGFEAAMAPGGPVEALLEMKARGNAQYIGISGGPVDMLQRFVETDLFDALITHNRFTLVDQSADILLDAATQRTMAISNAAPYGGGVLTGEARFRGTYGYRPIMPEVQAAIDSMARTCAKANVSLAAAALQFSLQDPRIHSTIVGISSLAGMNRAVTEASEEISASLWNELKNLRPPDFALDQVR